MIRSRALLTSALLEYVSCLFVSGALLFGAAGTFAYTQAWLFLILLFVPLLALGAALFLKAPELLVRQLQIGTRDDARQRVITLSGMLFLCVFVLAGTDFRIGWSTVPMWLVAVASVMLLLACALYAQTLREDARLLHSGTLRGLQVNDTGLHGVVRHPTYAATSLLFLSIPLVLGSFVSFMVMLLYPPLIAACIVKEEKHLVLSLPDYADYQKRVQYRLIPFVW